MTKYMKINEKSAGVILIAVVFVLLLQQFAPQLGGGLVVVFVEGIVGLIIGRGLVWYFWK